MNKSLLHRRFPPINSRENPYLSFIETCRCKPVQTNVEKHKHHILPKHWIDWENQEEVQFLESPENLIFLDLVDHIEAHKRLYELYGRKGDYGAFQMLAGNKSESRRIWRTLGAKAVHAKLKASQTNFWDPEFQTKLAQRSISKPDALQVRSNGGKIGGRNRHIGRVITRQDRYLFFMNGKPVLCCFNCETGGDVVRVLNQFSETGITRVTPLLKKTRKSSYGWSCIKLSRDS